MVPLNDTATGESGAKSASHVGQVAFEQAKQLSLQFASAFVTVYRDDSNNHSIHCSTFETLQDGILVAQFRNGKRSFKLMHNTDQCEIITMAIEEAANGLDHELEAGAVLKRTVEDMLRGVAENSCDDLLDHPHDEIVEHVHNRTGHVHTLSVIDELLGSSYLADTLKTWNGGEAL